MSQLRVPPGARTRSTSPLAQPSHKDCVSQIESSPRAIGADNPHTPPSLPGTHNVHMKVVGMSPAAHTHLHGHGLLKGKASSPVPKPRMVESFLDACFFCRRPLGHGKDIFMYRGDAAFCTEECRLRQISCDQKCSISASQITTSDGGVGDPKSTRITPPTGAF